MRQRLESHGERRGPMHAIAELALMRVDASSFQETLQRVAELAKGSLIGARDVSMTMVETVGPGARCTRVS